MNPSDPTAPAGGTYWRGVLAGFTAPTSLVVDRAGERGLRSTAEREEAERRVDAATTALLTDRLRAEGVDWGSLAEAAWGLLWTRYTGEEFCLAGVARDEGSAPLPVRFELTWDQSGLDLLKCVQAARVARAQHEATSLAAVRGEAEIAEGVPLFEAVLVAEATEARVEPELPWGAAALVVSVTTGDELLMRARWDARRLEREPVERMLGHLATLLRAFADDPGASVGAFPLITAAEHTQVVKTWNATDCEFPDECLHESIERQVARDPDALAVIAGDERLTFGELNARANRLAHHLRELGVGPDVPVGISLERRAEMVVGLLAITKAGGGYVPLDPTYPRERLAFLVQDSHVPVLVTQDSLAAGFADCDAEIVRVDGDADAIAARPDENPISGVTPLNLAYLIYTSGSTGTPKGVVLNHRGRVNNFADFNRRYDVGPGDKLLALASLSFDMCAYDVFGPLAAGATVVVGDTAGLEPGEWARLMVDHEITLWHSVPALLEMMIGHVETRPELCPRSLRLVLLGGDWVPVSLPDRIKAVAAPQMRVIVMGGATECSMDSTIYEVLESDASWKSIPYGGPMWNQRCYVLDRNRQPVPVGVPAELYLGGVGVGDGYHQRPELTAAKFLPNPWVPGERIYKTGDLARWRPDGNTELLGRMDFQVKIRGFRIELGEIESTLREHPAVHETVLVAREDEGREKRIVAYVIQDPDWSADDAGADERNDEQVGRWASVYDSAYGRGTDEQDPTFNIASWDSSYTGAAIPAVEMHEWVDRIVERIRSFEPARVLEIGCGTGLLLFRLAPHCEAYWGTDISKVALEHVQKHAGERGLEQVSTFERGGDDFSGMEPDSFDAVVLNSIVMDFPDPEYLVKVLEGASRVVRPGGFIFVGDVRNRRTLELFSSSVQLHRAPAGWSADQLHQSIAKQMEMEEELVIDPAFFVALRERIDRIGHVEIGLKRGVHKNEMVKFRYNALLFVGDGTEAPRFPDSGRRLDWDADGLSLAEVERILTEEQPAGLALARVPNARTWADGCMLERTLEVDGAVTVAALRDERARVEREQPGVEPEDLWALAERLPYAVDVRFAASGEESRFDALLVRCEDPGVGRPLPFGAEGGAEGEAEVDAGAPLSSYFNDPMRGAVQGTLTPALRAHLAERLPPYMVPAAFVYLEQFPLTPNGKINRRALPEPDRLRPELEEEYAAPATGVETVLAGIWAEGLGLDRVGMRDGFVALGGNSLLATQLTSRVRDVFQVDVSLKACLNLTLGELALELAEVGRQAGVDVAEVADIFIQIDQLSDTEVRTLLEEGVTGS
jgi:amino acid adenylation domain-containing protein